MNLDKPGHRQKIVLLITVGAQDVKLWVHSQNSKKPKLVWIEKPGIRAKHLALRERPESWTVLTESEASDPTNTGGELGEETRRLAAQLDLEIPVLSADGRLCLAAPKLEPVVEGILTHSDKMEVVGALIFYTERLEKASSSMTREHDHEYVNEPVASGHVAERYLRARFTLAPDQIAVVNCMEGCAGRYEGGFNQHDDFPLRREIVHRMDSAVSDFIMARETDFARKVVPVTMTTGGIDPFKQVVPAVAELRFASSVRDLSAPKTSDGASPEWSKLIDERLCAEKPRITRHEAISARGRALDLLRRGDPVSAWAAVHRLAGSQLDDWWLVPLKLTASYFGGAGAAVSTEAAENVRCAPGNKSATMCWREALVEVHLHDEDEFLRHRQFAVNAAMRVELALQGSSQESRRYPEALMAVCTFVDAAVIAQAIKFLRETEGAKETIENWLSNTGTERRTFFLKNDSDTPNNNRDAWFGSLLRREADTTAETELAEKMKGYFGALRALEVALGREKNKTNLRALRNNASHRALSESDVANISELGGWKKVAIWRAQSDGLGQHALRTPEKKSGWPGHIHAVLFPIGIEDIEKRYERLMGSLESILLTCEPATSP